MTLITETMASREIKNRSQTFGHFRSTRPAAAPTSWKCYVQSPHKFTHIQSFHAKAREGDGTTDNNTTGHGRVMIAQKGSLHVDPVIDLIQRAYQSPA